MNYFSCLAVFLSFVSISLVSSEQSPKRPWENWDQDNVAETIDNYWRGSNNEINHHRLLSYLVKDLYKPNDQLLDVGCSSGFLYEYIVPYIMKDANYTGIDNSNKMLALARTRNPYGNFQYGDIYDLPFPDNSFDIVICFEVISHLDNIEKPLSELFRVSSRDIVFTVWSSPSSPQTTLAEEHIVNSTFRHVIYSHKDIMEVINKAVKHHFYVTVVPLPGDIHAYFIHKY